MAGSELPQVEASEGQCQAVTDKQGRAFFGNVGLVEGSGRVQQDENRPDGEAARGLECLLVAAAGSGRGRSGCGRSMPVRVGIWRQSSLWLYLLSKLQCLLAAALAWAWAGEPRLYLNCLSGEVHWDKARGLQQAKGEVQAPCCKQPHWPSGTAPAEVCRQFVHRLVGEAARPL